ncbi:hypothetical protein [Streptomyces rishiriensis]|uniref:Lipoprotein n=1 Tax=Streptomyces rishiriensis TaxID=68264 RepID=A0ABU0NT97_STRRH|nr:hypothetical protein [Streptomyces rishiriensis]MDQ0582396.1 hypothetical protein [Streptomyces rishiriensis]
MATARHPLSAVAAGTVLSRGLVTGCGGDDGRAGAEATRQDRPRASASTTRLARYPGEAIPGLAPIGGGRNLVLPAEARLLDTGRGYATRGTGVNEPVSVIDRSTGTGGSPP